MFGNAIMIILGNVVLLGDIVIFDNDRKVLGGGNAILDLKVISL